MLRITDHQALGSGLSLLSDQGIRSTSMWRKKIIMFITVHRESWTLCEWEYEKLTLNIMLEHHIACRMKEPQLLQLQLKNQVSCIYLNSEELSWKVYGRHPGVVHNEEKNSKALKPFFVLCFVIQGGAQKPVFKYLDSLPGFSETLTTCGCSFQWESEVLYGGLSAFFVLQWDLRDHLLHLIN